MGVDRVVLRVRDGCRPGLLVVVGVTPREQKLSALEKANNIRRENARLKAELRGLDGPDSHRRAVAVLTNLEEHETVGSLRVKDFVGSVRGVGHARVARFLARAGVTPSRRIRELTFRQVHGLVSELDASGNQIERGRRTHG